MTTEEKRVNRELLVILNQFHLTDKIPSELLQNLQNNQDESWPFVYEENLKLEEQKIKRQTAILFSDIYIMYICKDEAERARLKQIYIDNEEKRKRKNDFAFLQKEAAVHDEGKEELTNLPAVQENKDSIWTKIKKLIKKLLVHNR
ncbi:MAG: hypothetical protein IJ867_03375 [Clostridia bacterium]|nr:hypothetical protein [Clostridia bacterium]